MKRIKTYFRNFSKYSSAEKRLFFEALFYTFLAKLSLLVFSFKYCVKLTAFKKATSQPIDQHQLLHIKKAIARANHLAFWKNVCLVQSLAARWMLNRRGISSQLKLGVTHDDNKKIIAHAWVIVNDFEVVNKGSSYHELISF